MKINEALKELKKVRKTNKKATLYAKSIDYYRQTKRTLIYWLLENTSSSDERKHEELQRILDADWEITT